MRNDIISDSKILIVDDQPANLSILFEYLTEFNAHIMLIQEPEEALKISESKCPDIILLDIIMPEMNGYDVCRKLKENEKTFHIPVIFMSGLSETEDIVKGFDAGGVDFIVKPLRKEEVLSRIATHLRICRTEKELKKQSLMLIEVNDTLKAINETKDKMLSIISHDIRTPIGNIVSFVDMILSDYDFYDMEKIRAYLDIIKFSASSCYHLIDNLLKWAFIQKKQLKPNPRIIDLKELTLEMISFFSNSADKKDIKLKSEIFKDIKVWADEEMIKTIIRNLISNAIKFTNKSGRIIINAAVKEGFVEFSVSDNGVGIEDERLEKIFNKKDFTTTYGTENEKGSGLGLILCSDFIELNDGKIWVESEAGKGSNFIFTLPVPGL